MVNELPLAHASVVHGMERDNETLRISVGDLKGMVTGHAADTASLHSQLRDALERQRTMRAEREEVEQELRALRRQLNDALHEASQLSEQLEDSSRTLADTQAKGAAREAEAQQLIAAGEEALQALQEELDTLRSSCGDQNRDALEARAAMEKMIRALEADMARLGQEASAAQQRFEEERAVSKGLEKALHRTQTEHEALVQATASHVDDAARQIRVRARTVEARIGHTTRELDKYKLWYEGEHARASALSTEL